MKRTELQELLGDKVGDEAARTAINEVASRLGLSGDEYDKDQAMAILEDLAMQPGLLGVVSRFAKARVILRFSGTSPTPRSRGRQS